MPRQRRIVIPGVAHHVIQRGNNRQWIFEEKEDFSTYCYLINKYAQKYKVSILAYCLMNNHVHFVLTPEDKTGMARLFGTVHMRYAQYKNYKRKTSGHLWQGRFFSCLCGGTHLYYAIRYVEQNPMRAKMVKHPWEYEWSSAKWHVRLRVKNYIKLSDNSVVDSMFWKKYLMSDNAKIDDEIRRKTAKGKAFADNELINCWEKKLGCTLRELKPGPKENN